MLKQVLGWLIALGMLQALHAYEIDLPADAIPAEKTAARELGSFLNRMGFSPGDAPRIVLGQSPETTAALGIDWKELRPDEIILREVDGTLYLTGDRPRGTLYAVYEYLNRCGVRFWTSDTDYVPNLTELTVKGLNVRYAPPFISRGAPYSDIVRHPEFAARTRNNGTGWGPDEEWGGNMGILGWCHTFHMMISPESYFEKNPEWFSLNAKERRRNTQLCLSNEAMRKEITQNLRNWIRENPDFPIISISQNDNGGGCECAECAALDARYGGPGGTMIWFVNQIAEELGKEFPDKKFDTLAYLHTTRPPENIVPAPNVIVRLCFIGGNFARPLDSEANAQIRDELKGWGKCTKQLAVWNYITDFNNPLIPFPNIRNLGLDLRFFRDNGVISVFDQANPHTWGGDELSELRGWVVSKLMWNPDLDESALIEEFVHGYYGEAAAPHILAYLAEIDAELDRDAVPWAGIECSTTAPWQSTESAVRCLEHMNRAIEATATDPVLSARVRKAALASRYAILTRYEATRWCADQGTFAKLDLRSLLEETLKWSHEFEFERMGGAFTDRTAQLEKVVGASADMELPDSCKGLNQNDFIVLPYTLFTIKCPDAWNWIVDDESASLNKSVMFTGDYSTWLLEVTPSVPDYQDEWTIYAELRCESGNASVNALQVGMYDWGTATELGKTTIPASVIEGKQFKAVPIGTFRLTPTASVYFQPCQNNNMKIYVDRVFAVRTVKKK